MPCLHAPNKRLRFWLSERLRITVLDKLKTSIRICWNEIFYRRGFPKSLPSITQRYTRTGKKSLLNLR